MKKSLIIVFLLCAVKVISQDQFTGKIGFEVTFDGEGADDMRSMMPTGYTFYMSGNKTRFEIEGGLMAILMGYVIHDGKETYMVHDETQVAYKLVGDNTSEDDTQANSTVTKLDETETIMGYKCAKYKVVTTEDSTETIQYVWATTKLKVKLTEESGGSTFSVDGVEGFPLKMQSDMDGITMTMVVSKIDTQKPDESLFKLPEGYTIEEMDPNNF